MPQVGIRQEVAMMPHPITMPFAWEDEVLRGSRVLLVILGLTISTVLGGVALRDHAPNASSAVAAEPSMQETHLSDPALVGFPAE
jgi:hypothetical protein